MIRRSKTRGTRLAALGFLVAGSAVAGSACYSTGSGSAPRLDNFYFPVGLAVPPLGNALYVVNSDFDLQYNGGTVQAYDLPQIRIDTQENINQGGQSPTLLSRGIYARQGLDLQPGDCPGDLPTYVNDGSKQRQPLGQTCSPPTHSEKYVGHDANGNSRSVVIGAFATDLQIAKSGDRLLIPVRGDASLTWIDIDKTGADPLNLGCAADTDHRCLAMAPNVKSPYQAGNDPNYPDTNTRHLQMPGEPFGMSLSEDGSSVVITHQNDTMTSLFSTGCTPALDPVTGRTQHDALGNVVCQGTEVAPSLEFILSGVPVGGNGVTEVPHDPDAFPQNVVGATPLPRNAFLETSRAVAEIDLLRYYSDQSPNVVGSPDPALQSSLHRPFLLREAAFSITANASGIDSRGVVIDDTPRRACKLKYVRNGVSTATPAQLASCARLPARVFIANRAPASIIIGDIGEPATSADQTYDPDRLVLYGNQPLTTGPSNLYLAPIVDAQGRYALRLFIVCFDSATIFVWDPEAGQMENIIRVGQGPFAMAFDPFDMDAVANHEAPKPDPTLIDGKGQPSTKYRFAYIASFTQSYVQVLDLSQKQPETYERVVYTLGEPTLPKGTN